MFGLKEVRRKIEDNDLYLRTRINEVGDRIDEINKKNNFVECDTCGCLLKKSTAVRGKSTIIHARDASSLMFSLYPSYHEEIQEHYFCKVHAPKTKK